MAFLTNLPLWLVIALSITMANFSYHMAPWCDVVKYLAVQIVDKQPNHREKVSRLNVSITLTSWLYWCILWHPDYTDVYPGILTILMYTLTSWLYCCIPWHPDYTDVYSDIISILMYSLASLLYWCIPWHPGLMYL